MQKSEFCRSRRELSNEYLLAKFGFDTAENEPCKVCPLSAYGSLLVLQILQVSHTVTFGEKVYFVGIAANAKDEYSIMEIDCPTSAVREVGPRLAKQFRFSTMVRVKNDVLIAPWSPAGKAIVMHLPDASPIQSVGSYMAKLAWEPAVWDVVVTCAGEELKGNRCILSRVPFFAAALDGRFRA